METNYLFEIMSAITMLCPLETDKHKALAECLSPMDPVRAPPARRKILKLDTDFILKLLLLLVAQPVKVC